MDRAREQPVSKVAAPLRSRQITQWPDGQKVRDDVVLACRVVARGSRRTQLLVDMAEKILKGRPAADVWIIAEFALKIELQIVLQWVAKIEASVNRAKAGDADTVLVGDWRRPQALWAALQAPTARSITRRPVHASDKEVFAARGLLLLYEALEGEREGAMDKLLDAAEFIYIAARKGTMSPQRPRARWIAVLHDGWPELQALHSRVEVRHAIIFLVRQSNGFITHDGANLMVTDYDGTRGRVVRKSVSNELTKLRRKA